MSEIPVINSENINQNVKQFNSDSRFLLKFFSSLEAAQMNSLDINVNNYIPVLSPQELSSAVRKNGVLHRAVYSFPVTASSSWIRLNYGKQTKQNPDDVLTYIRNIPWYVTWKIQIEDYGARSAFKYASGLARKFGSAYIVLGVEDNQDLSEPIETRKIKAISWMKVYDCHQLTYQPGNSVLKVNPDEIKNQATLANSDYYDYYGVKIHPSRVLAFYGNRLDSAEEIVQSNYKHDSIMLGLFETFTNWLVGNKAIAQLLLSSSMYKVGMESLGDRINQDIESGTTTNQDAIKIRADSISRGMNVTKILFFDKEFEELEAISRNLTGTKDAFEALKEGFAATSDMPRWKLFNEFGSGGLGASEQTAQIMRYQWAFEVCDWSYNNWLQPLDRLIKLCMQSRDLYGLIIDAYTEDSIEFKLNVRSTVKEQMEVEKLGAERSKIMNEIVNDNGALTKAEIRSQYMSAMFNPNITLDS